MGYKPNIRHLQPLILNYIDPVFLGGIYVVVTCHPPHLEGMKFCHLGTRSGVFLLRLGNYLLNGMILQDATHHRDDIAFFAAGIPVN